jgi:basic membrane protein A
VKFAMRTLFINIAAIGLVACFPAKDSANTNKFRVALLTPGPISDQSWNGGAYAGLMRIRDSLDAEVSHIQTKTPAEFEQNFRQYGAGGYTLVFGHGFEFQDAASRVAPEFPKTMFVTTGGSATGVNQAAMGFSFGQPSFLAGFVAGSVTKSGIVGCIGGTELPPVKASFAAFTAGVHAANPKATILVSYIGNWDDASAGKEQALAQIGRGTDVIFQNADAAGLGVFQAAKQTHGVFVIGSNADQNSIAPSVTLGSVLIDLPRAFMIVAREAKSGTFKGRLIQFDTKTDVVRWVPNPSLPNAIPRDVTVRVDSIRATMLTERFVMPPPS